MIIYHSYWFSTFDAKHIRLYKILMKIFFQTINKGRGATRPNNLKLLSAERRPLNYIIPAYRRIPTSDFSQQFIQDKVIYYKIYYYIINSTTNIILAYFALFYLLISFNRLSSLSAL